MHTGHVSEQGVARAGTKALVNNIASKEAPLTSELFAHHVSRLNMKQRQI